MFAGAELALQGRWIWKLRPQTLHSVLSPGDSEGLEGRKETSCSLLRQTKEKQRKENGMSAQIGEGVGRTKSRQEKTSYGED